MTTTNLKLKWLKKRKAIYLKKINTAFSKVRQEIIEFLRQPGVDKSVFARYLSTCIGTSDVPTFINIMKGIINDAQKASEDPEAKFAIRFCKYALFRFHLLSNFTYQWTNITVYCDHCHNIISMNFCYTNKICPICGAILLKDKETYNK